MTILLHAQPPEMAKGPRIGLGVTIAVVVVFAAVAAWLVIAFLSAERERDSLSWQRRLGIVADSRAAAVDDWVGRQLGAMVGLADNPGIRLYLTQVAAGGGQQPDTPEASAQATFMRNLLTVVADRFGFAAPPAGPNVSANVGRVGVAGIAATDLDGRILVATQNMPPVTGGVLAFLVSADRGRTAVLDLYRDGEGQVMMGFAAPIYPVQGDPVADQQLGWILGVKPVAAELFGLLRQPGTVEETAEAVLVRESGGIVTYLSPLLDGTGALERNLTADTPNLAAAYALATPDGFAERTDYRGEPVLVVSRALGPPTGWTLMYKVDRSEALAEADARRTRLAVVFVLVIGLVGLAIAGVWFYGTSRRARRSAEQYRAIAEQLDRNQRFLKLVTDSQPNVIFISAPDGRLAFANRQLGLATGVDQQDIAGKPLANVIGPHLAAHYDALSRQALERGETVTDTIRGERNGAVRVARSAHIPLPAESELAGSVLVVEEDLTETVLERERREQILREVVGALVTLVDKRDPYSADHSRRVSRLGGIVAAEMGLPPVTVETTQTAAELMNLGKIVVPIEILTKPGRLTEAELGQVRESIRTSAELIRTIAFDGPVYETLCQVQEKVDGSGWPDGLSGEGILLPARIIAVVNAFVAMVSPRAHRSGLGVDEALDILSQQSGKALDRNVIAALIHFLNNKGGREQL